jgi:hypothetical protein
MKRYPMDEKSGKSGKSPHKGNKSPPMKMRKKGHKGDSSMGMKEKFE